MILREKRRKQQLYCFRSDEKIIKINHNNTFATSKAYLLVVPIVIVADVFLFIYNPALDFAHNVLFGVKRE